MKREIKRLQVYLKHEMKHDCQESKCCAEEKEVSNSGLGTLPTLKGERAEGGKGI
jgi:hypothetical protein